MLGALRLILLATLKNRVRVQLRRLRRPRYLVATGLGLAYWWWYFGRFLGGLGRARPGLPAAWRPTAELGLAGLALVIVLLGWIFGSDRSALTFSEAEIQFLFPAPLTRRALLHFKLLRMLLLGLLGAAFTTLIMGRALSSQPVLFALGAWISLTTLSLHQVASAFTRAGLARPGRSGLRRGVAALVAVAAAAGLLAWAATEVTAPGPFAPEREWLLAWVAAVDASPLGLVLWPVRAPIRLALAPGLGPFLAALPGALLVLGLHYVWVMSVVVRFEDGAVAGAERRARLVAARAQGSRALVRAPGRRRPPFRLAPRGPPEAALLWKGLIAGGRTVSLRAFVIASTAVGLLLSASLLSGVAPGGLGVVSILAAAVWAMTLLLGPGMIRTDLRLDLANLDLLRALPIDGTRLLRGLLLAPLATLVALQWLVLPLAVAAPALGLDLGERVAVAAAAAVLGPAMALAALTLQNGFVILLPAWVEGGAARQRGPEAVGMRLIEMLLHLLALALGLLPAALAGGLVLLATAPVLGLHAAPLGAGVAALVVLLEVWLATAGLGRLLDRLDPSEL